MSTLSYSGLVESGIRSLCVGQSGKLFAVQSRIDLTSASLVEIDRVIGGISVLTSIPFGLTSLCTGADRLLYGWNTLRREVQVYDESGVQVATTQFTESTTNYTIVQSMEYINGKLVIHRQDQDPDSSEYTYTLDELDLSTGELTTRVDLEAPLDFVRGMAYVVLEPGTIMLMVIGLPLFLMRRWRRGW